MAGWAFLFSGGWPGLSGGDADPRGSGDPLARCAGHVQQLGSESLLPNLMEVKG